MRILGNYVVFFISMMGMTLADNDNKYQQFYKELLELHNKYRKMHDAIELIMDAELSSKAKKIAVDHDISSDPDVDFNIESNIYFGELNTEPNADVVFHYWYNEWQNYTRIDDPFERLKTNAFTQIVWKDTTHIGMAVHEGIDHLIVVATYSPPGNKLGEYSSNVVTIEDKMDQINYQMDPSDSWGIKKQRTC